MKILIVGYGFYVLGDKNSIGGTVLPATLSWCNQNGQNSIDIFARKDSQDLAKKRLKKYIENNSLTIGNQNINIVSDTDNKYDVAMIAVPEMAHLEVLKSISHVKDVMCVKPVGASNFDYAKICQLAKENKQNFYVDFHKRFDPANISIMNEIKSTKDSNYYFSFSYGQKKEMIEEYFSKWFQKSNPFQYLGPHYLDIILYSTGLLNKDLKVNCKVDVPFRDKDGTPLFVCGTIVVSSDKVEVTISFDCNWFEPNTMPYSSRQRIEGFSKSLRFVSEQDNRGLMFWNDSVNIPNPHYRSEALSDAWGYGVDIYKRFLQQSVSDSVDDFLPSLSDYKNVAKIINEVNNKIYEIN